jgi:hypothetical protein
LAEQREDFLLKSLACNRKAYWISDQSIHGVKTWQPP